MTPNRWQQISVLYHAALGRAAGGRGVFLCDACGGDDSLRAEVESLLAQPASAEALFAAPAVARAAALVSDPGMSVMISRRSTPQTKGTRRQGPVFRRVLS